MAKSKKFTITKDFSSKTLEKVFVEQVSDTEITEAPSLREEIESALKQAETVCLVAETAFSDELMNLLYEMRQNHGLRIYILIKDVQQKASALERLKENCIVREVPHIRGNYLLCDKPAAFFFDGEMNGYAVKNEETVQKLHNLFIYNFWKESTKEFIQEVRDVAEQTFDVAPVHADENVIIDCSALEEPPYRQCLENADSFVTLGTFPKRLKDTNSGSTLYLDSKAWESNKDVLLKEQNRTVILTDKLSIPMCKSEGNWYILNNNFDNDDNTGRFFSVKMECEPVFINTRKFYPTFTYGEAVGKTLFYAKDFENVEILSEDTEERSVSYDHKRFKEIVRMEETEREKFFDKQHLLHSDKLVATVTFTVTMTVKKLSKGAKEAPVYEEYKSFIAEVETRRKETEQKKISVEKSQETDKNNLETVTQKLDAFQAKKQEYERDCQEKEELEGKISELKEQIQQAKQESGGNGKGLLKKAKGESFGVNNEFEKQLSELQGQEKVLEEKIKKFQKEKKTGEQLANERDVIQKKLTETEESLKKLADLMAAFDRLPKKPETVVECEAIKSQLPDDFNLKVPSFDKPRYGTLYEIKNDYEYEVNSDDHFDEAEEEMRKAGLENVHFVSIS